MSEYQYYEFQKADGRLSESEMQALRACSSRARITPASFANEYNYGDFKGNSDAWMEKYFDGFLYLANWGTREVQLAIPADVIQQETMKRHGISRAFSSREKSGKLILKFRLESEPAGEWLEGEGYLPALLPIRNELARGDLRALYLGWLTSLESGELEDTDPEPPVPANLHELSGPQETLAQFMRLDSDLLAVAAEKSLRMPPKEENSEEKLRWVASLPVREKDELLVKVMGGASAGVGMELQSRFKSQQGGGLASTGEKRRTAAELLAAAEALRENRRREKREKAAQEKALREQLAAEAREKHLNSLTGRSESIWNTVNSLVATRLPKSYDEAARHLADLRELAEREKRQEEFKKRFDVLRAQHRARTSLMERLAKLEPSEPGETPEA